jgi:hypothetical protein
MIRKGCENCRRRHVKCTINEDASVCVKCAEFGRECELGPRFRFHNVRYIYQKDGNSREKYEFSWDCRQTWVNVLSPGELVVRFFCDFCYLILPQPYISKFVILAEAVT